MLTGRVGKVGNKESNYKNHRKFTLRCISKDLIPVSIRLKATRNSRSRRAREIIHKAKNNYFRIALSA